MLKLNNVHTSYGKVEALKGISLEVKQGEIVALIGANGAGKTTLLKTISGLLSLTQGEIEFENEKISGLSAHEISKRGIIQVPEGRKIFPRLTVRENLEMGAYQRKKKEIAQSLEQVYTLFPILKEREKQLGLTLSGGEQQMLAIARGLMSNPQLLMFDEPSMGLAPVLVEKTFQIIRELNQFGKTILLVEQNAYQALRIASRGYVLETGKITLTDSADNLLKNEDVRKAYLGGQKS